MTMKTTKTGQNQKFSRKVREEGVEVTLNHKLFSENFMCDPLSVIFKPIGNINIWIM